VLEVETNRRIESTDELDADVVVVTAGSWIRDLVPDVPVTVTRETVAYFKREGPPPPSIVDLNARPAATACTRSTTRCTGSRRERTTPAPRRIPTPRRRPIPRSSSASPPGCASASPEVDPEPVEAQSCLYTTTSDEHFVLERRGRVVVGSACSGHGFKFAPAVGRRLADLALS
jgi:sarcosine oxidase